MMELYYIWIKKYWRYLLVISLAIFIIIYYLFIKKSNNHISVETSHKLSDGLGEVKDKLVEISTQATIETAIAKTKHETMKSELKEVVKIKDNNERRKRLIQMADFMGTTN
jgi:hypothetical protein